MQSWFQYAVLVSVYVAVVCVLVAPVFVLRFFFRRARWHWLSSHAILFSITVTAMGWACLGAVSLYVAQPPPRATAPSDVNSGSQAPLEPPPDATASGDQPGAQEERKPQAAREPPPPGNAHSKGVGAPPAGIDEEVLEREALDLAKGKIAFDVPPEMREGKSRRVEVRIARGVDQDITSLLTDKLRKTAQVDEIQVAPFMIVMLGADKSIFEITPLTEDKQLVSGDGYTTWAWAVKPLQPGKCTLYLTVGTRFKLPNREEETKFRPLYRRDISVQVDRRYETEQFLSGNWQWITATLLIPLIGFIWHNRKRKPRQTELNP